MPELAELKITADYVNQRAQNRVFYSVKKNPVHKGKEVEVPFQAFTISAESRGKELMLTLTQINTSNQIKLLMTMGMSGYFKWVEEGVYSKHSHLRFQSEGGSLDFVDVRRFGKWKVVEDWSKDRGPDPTTEFEAFVHHIGRHILSKDFQKPIYEVLMNQKYFNGIGNYLRAEIIYKLAVNPFQSACQAIQSCPDILIMCKHIPLQAYKLGGGSIKDWQNPFDDSPKNWDEFMKCYGNPNMNTLIDRNGRRFWYSSKWDDEKELDMETQWDHYSDLPNPRAYETK